MVANWKHSKHSLRLISACGKPHSLRLCDFPGYGNSSDIIMFPLEILVCTYHVVVYSMHSGVRKALLPSIFFVLGFSFRARLHRTRKAGDMIHYVYATRGGYLYMVGRYNHRPSVENVGEFVLSVPEKTPQVAIDTLAHRRFLEHLRRPRKVAHDRHKAANADRELVTV